MPVNQFQKKDLSHEPVLLSRISKGDEAAFRKLFEDWHPFLASHIYHITNSTTITEEIVHDVFLKIWLTRETLEEIRDFKAYLVIVSRNHALNALRKLANETRQLKEWLKNVDEPAATDPTIAYYSLFDEAVDQLTERQKEIYLLHRHQRLTYDSIAQKLQLSRETVKSHLQSAIASITRYIKSRVNTLKL